MNLPDFVRRPISQHLPHGVNPNTLDDFSEIKRQVNKLSTVTSIISWKKVHSLSKNILLNESKDIRCACYYTVSATHIDGLKGLVGGLNALLDMCVIYWYSGYPEENKTTARKGAIEWLTEHTIRKQKTLKITTSDLPLIETGYKLTLNIEEELRSHYGVKSPSLSGIRRIFSQWIEDIQEDKIPHVNHKKTHNANNDKEALQNIEYQADDENVAASVVKSPPINNQAPRTGKNNSKSFGAVVIGIFLLLLFTHFFYNDNQTQHLKEKIKTANTHEMIKILSTLEYKKDDVKQSIKPNIIQQTQRLLSNWTLDPMKINQLKTLNLAIQQLQKNYPDSVAANEMKANIILQTEELDQEYTRINQQFLKSRTVFANAQEKDSAMIKAYDYSNSLFPLLGRIEYAEKKMTLAEINRTQRLLNVYQHKINTLKDNF